MEKLEECITNGDADGLMDLLIENPALATGTTSHQISPLMLSCYYKKPQITDVLLKVIDDISLFEAAAAGQFDKVGQLITANTNIINDYTADGFTPLGLACYFGQ